MEIIEAIKQKIQDASKDYPEIRKCIKNEKGMVYCANRISHMMKYENCDFSGACAWLESELEGMD
jgi:hypothetical protein